MLLKNLKRYSAIILIINSSWSTAQSSYDSLFYYNADGSQNWWYVQKDVFTFRCVNGNGFTAQCTPGIVDDVVYHQNGQRQMMEVKFNPASTPLQRAFEVNSIMQSGEVESTALAITKNVNSTNTYFDNKYLRTNDLLLVTFDDADISAQRIADFQTRNHLISVHTPPAGLPEWNWSYVMRIHPDKWINSIDAAKTIFHNEDSMLYQCIPDQIGLELLACEPVNEFDVHSQINMPDRLWHLRNEGNVINTIYSNGNFDNDADICECWGEGYHGNGIKVAVIDVGGYDFAHPRMQGRFLPGWDVRYSSVAVIDGTYWDDTFNPQVQDHGMRVASTISANANLGVDGAVGVAYQSKIIPIMTATYVGTTRINVGIQYAILEGADIINISMGVDDPNGTTIQSGFYNEIDGALTTGRNGLGTLVVSGAGKFDTGTKFFPAADFNCFGVGASTPTDIRASHTNNPSWGIGNNEGSHWWLPDPGEGNNARYNVVAPGALIMGSYSEDVFSGTTLHKSSPWGGTSAAGPVVCGIAAILLEKNYGLTAQDLKDAIQNNAEQVNAYSYSTFSYIPGYNQEMFFGRVNCFNAINDVAVDIEEQSSNSKFGFDVINLGQNSFLINLSTKYDLSSSCLTVYDLSGKELLTRHLDQENYSIYLNLNEFSNGLYIVSVSDFKKGMRVSKKIFL